MTLLIEVAENFSQVGGIFQVGVVRSFLRQGDEHRLLNVGPEELVHINFSVEDEIRLVVIGTPHLTQFEDMACRLAQGFDLADVH